MLGYSLEKCRELDPALKKYQLISKTINESFYNILYGN